MTKRPTNALKKVSGNQKGSKRVLLKTPELTVMGDDSQIEIVSCWTLVDRVFLTMFLSVWLSGWTFGLYELLMQWLTNPTVGVFIALNFWTGFWFLGLCLLFPVWSKDKIVLDKQQMTISVTLAFVQIRQETVASIDVANVKLRRHKRDRHRPYSVSFSATGDFFVIGEQLYHEEANLLARLILNFLPNSKKSGKMSQTATDDLVRTWMQSETKKDQSNVLVFHHCGDLDVVSIVVLGFLNMFWNGALAVTCSGLVNESMTELKNLAILVPFLTVGIFLAARFLVVFLEGVHESTLWVHPNQIKRTNRYLGIKFRKIWSGDLTDCTLSKEPMKRKWPVLILIEGISRWTGGFADPSSSNLPLETFQLSMRHNNATVFQQKRLTESDAEWMATLISEQMGPQFVEPKLN